MIIRIVAVAIILLSAALPQMQIGRTGLETPAEISEPALNELGSACSGMPTRQSDHIRMAALCFRDHL
jgi:hypothetical protein